MSRADPRILTDHVKVQTCRHNLALFAREYLGMEIGDHHEEWADIVNRHDLIDIEAARGHGKSGFFSYAYPIWRSWRDPGQSGLIVSSTDSQVGEFFRLIKDGKTFVEKETGIVFKMPCLLDTPIRNMLPKGYERKWTESKIYFKNGSRFIGRSMRSRFRGFHGNWIVVDDPHGREVGFSQLVRDRDCAFLEADLLPMLLPGGQCIVPGTPMHEDDIHGRNSRNPDWFHKKFPAKHVGADGKDHALWPELRSLAWLARRERSMSTILFRQEYMLVPASSESSLFPMSLFRERRETLAEWLTLKPTAAQMAARSDWLYFAGVDLALSASSSGDYTVITVLGVDTNANMHIVELVRVRGVAYHEQLAIITDTLAPYLNAGVLATVMVEANQMQRIFGDELARTSLLPIKKFYTSGGEKHSLERGVPSLRMYVENGKLRIPRGDAASREATDVLLSEMQSFAWLKGKLQGVGQHDDTVMSLWIATVGVLKGNGFLFTSIDMDIPDEVVEAYTAEDVAPWRPIPDDLDDPGVLDGAAGMALVMRRGYVPPTCVLAPLDGAHYVVGQVKAGRSPCWSCSAPRAKCGGEPLRVEIAPTVHDLVQVEAARQSPPRPAPEPNDIDRLHAIIELCGGNETLGRLIPPGRDAQREAYNAIMFGGTLPGWATIARDRGELDTALEALDRMLEGDDGQ